MYLVLLIMWTLLGGSAVASDLNEKQGTPLSQKVQSKTDGKTPKFMVIPVYYLTDREIQGETYGPHRRYPTNCEHHMYYGTAYVSVPNVKQKAAVDSLDWKSSDNRPPKISQKDRIDPTDPAQCKKTFFDNLAKVLDKTGQDDLCVFVHGAADPFEECAQDAAQLAYYLEKPLVLYSWPSDPKRRGYFIDGVNSEWSQGHFNLFCKDLLSFKENHPLEVIFLSHSMGNRLVVRALPVVYGKHLIKDAELISPDIDADTCRHYVMGFPPQKARVRLYVSNRDKMLPLSQLLSGGYYRVGEACNPGARSAKELESIGLKFQNTPLFERIDFTAIDTGWSGHSIPSELVANMIAHDKPGAGLALISEEQIRASRLARLAGRSTEHTDVSEVSLSSRVVKIKD